MPLTRKHYNLLAGAIQYATETFAHESTHNTEYQDGARFMRALILTQLCNVLRSDNSNFDEERFRDACLARMRDYA